MKCSVLMQPFLLHQRIFTGCCEDNLDLTEPKGRCEGNLDLTRPVLTFSERGLAIHRIRSKFVRYLAKSHIEAGCKPVTHSATCPIAYIKLLQ